MAHELRKLMAQADNHASLSGHVEIDETLIGGQQTREDTKKKGTNKTIVMGMVERNGILRAGPIKDVKTETLESIVVKNVDIGSTVSTDEWPGYNSLEGHWSLLKRSIKGTHVHVSGKHLWKYVSEFSYRHNMRKSHYAMFHQLVASFSLPRLVES